EPGTTTAAGAVFHPIFQISRSSSNMQSVDSNKNGWPDKCNCVLSELNTDENNCGSCGYVCTGGQTCFDSECCTPVDGVWSGWSHTNGYDDGAGGTCSEPCGGGTQSRTCTNPAPYCDGANCVGDSTQDCNIQPCCQTGYSYSEPYTFWYVFDTGHGKVWWSGSNLGSHGGSSSIVVGSYEYFPGDWKYRWGVSPNGPGSYIDYYEVRRCLLR
ncbi:MAG: hypothetical protein KAU24_00245, partial [Candidatus Aenigmarchaeota archaeon]|nr:hypothetical protein [Candidatus Aenigmarchaeota archaeon]